MTYPYLPYAITEGYCLIYAVTVLLRMNNSIGTEHEVRELRNMIWAYLSMLVTDILWALNEDGILILARPLNAAVNGIAVMSIALGCFFWYKFIESRLMLIRPDQKRLRRLAAVPIIVIILLDAISVFTGWLFFIDENNRYDSTSLFFIQSIVNYVYLLIPTVASLRRAVQTRSRLERGEYATYSVYMIAPLIAGLLEDVLPTVPMLALNIFMIIHILFLMIQNMQISTDALTDLNNRRRLNQYLEERLPRASAAHPLIVLMMDLNGFKAINDTHGHLEGDHALRLFAGVLKRTAAQTGAFIARYGGDEFCLVADGAGTTPEQLTENVRALLRTEQTAPAPYTLTVSAGFAVSGEAESDPNGIISRADAMLYENKKEWHRANG